MNMTIITPLFLLCLTLLVGTTESVAEICRGTHCFSSEDWNRPCTGAHCQRRTDAAPQDLNPVMQDRQAFVKPLYQDAHTKHQTRSAQVPYTIIQPHRGGTATSDTQKENPRSITAEVYHPGCKGGNCQASQPRPTRTESVPRECKGIECKLPLRMRPKPKPQPCIGDSCVTGGGEDPRGQQPPLVHDRAAQFLGEFPEFGSERGSSPLGIQLTCDIKPGNNEVPSEDTLVLQLRLAKGQEKLVEALKGQQEEIRELQSRLSQQQGTLVSQQREILEEQSRLSQQMDQVKAQYGLLLENVKQMSFQGMQEELESHMVALRGQARAHHTQAYAVHKVDMEARVMDVDLPVLACRSCGAEEYCDFRTGPPQCERCTICPAGFFLVSQCSIHADRICQDRDECLEVANLCSEQKKCLNTPGGFRCQGLSDREASTGLCGHGYFYNSEMEECQACQECEVEQVATPCTFTSDTICSTPSTTDSSRLSLSWAGVVTLPPTKSHAPGHAFPNLQLHIHGRGDSNLLATEDGHLVLRQHGLVWADENLALSHGCRSFVQVCLQLNTSDLTEGRDLSGVRVEQREVKSLQSASVSGVAEVAPGSMLSLLLRSASHHCNHTSDGLHLHDPSVAPLSLFWLSHDTGAVAMTAQAVSSAHYHTNYRPAFKTTSTSDPYVVGLTHDGRGVRFTESGTVRFVFQQALYSMGQACVTEGFHLLAYLNHNGSSMELARTYKTGVHYRDTSISLSAATMVGPGDTLGFEILSPGQCNIRYFGDDSGISALSLVWIPTAISSALSASVARTGLPSGAVRNKPLYFHQVSPHMPQMQVGLPGKGRAEQGREFVFTESGTASFALDLKLIHSCNPVKITLLRHRGEGAGEEGKPVPLAQQFGGQMPEGSGWASVGLRASFQVHNGTAVYVTLDCLRGRINQISHQTGSGVSILWVAA
ncbi:uncharacterized protein si:ch211-252f13.5 [Oncorhynchus tshawytscha]|uniref:uncharacterized protein si:ch211-252f13.5 n=1 Tax=Oncorhynchus tshawytscha TaxID=74940 RepID=UPI000D099771|nr:uncharacterized protein si:ch211-252f13.5 [Oncorhynchus tshawytscha]